MESTQKNHDICLYGNCRGLAKLTRLNAAGTARALLSIVLARPPTDSPPCLGFSAHAHPLKQDTSPSGTGHSRSSLSGTTPSFFTLRSRRPLHPLHRCRQLAVALHRIGLDWRSAATLRTRSAAPLSDSPHSHSPGLTRSLARMLGGRAPGRRGTSLTKQGLLGRGGPPRTPGGLPLNGT